jgi:FkbM family methyltransferase
VSAPAARPKDDPATRRHALIGAGQLGAMALQLWPAAIARPEFILDSVKTGELDGIPIRGLRGHRRVPGVTYLASAYKMTAPQMKDIFAAIGQDDIRPVYDVFEEFTPAIFGNGWHNLSPTPETERRLARLPQFYTDDLSRQVCRAATAWRYRRALVDDYPVGPEHNKYNLRLFGRAGTHYDVVYDCGSYDFGLVKMLAAAGVGFDTIASFEADAKSHAVCRERIAAWQETAKAEALLDPRAVADHDGHGAFVASGLLTARLIAAPALEHPHLTVVETCTLDGFHEERFGWYASRPQRILIKLHIEGAELAALKGAEHIIRTTNADVLLNLSHDEPSYLEIPEFLASFGRHDLFLRSHSLFGEGLTLFARHRT